MKGLWRALQISALVVFVLLALLILVVAFWVAIAYFELAGLLIFIPALLAVYFLTGLWVFRRRKT